MFPNFPFPSARLQLRIRSHPPSPMSRQRWSLFPNRTIVSDVDEPDEWGNVNESDVLDPRLIGDDSRNVGIEDRTSRGKMESLQIFNLLILLHNIPSNSFTIC